MSLYVQIDNYPSGDDVPVLRACFPLTAPQNQKGLRKLSIVVYAPDLYFVFDNIILPSLVLADFSNSGQEHNWRQKSFEFICIFSAKMVKRARHRRPVLTDGLAMISVLTFWGSLVFSQCMWDICCSVSVVMFCFSLQFVVGDNEVENFRMIERHYFRDRVLFLR